ncbi:translation initiation factor 2 [Streptomyces sp. LP05-1]|uniref:Translation initiation factor 2 n=1 Tax=Streptomyces pyxinae TaxID=2970734 RepID=A0ABT2CJ95_9ACTN|nr:translation initiation factor 2 [Streptomyces sp. LP05-1]MCS0637490.1 translation initiation factor 2 [Streptomyces sp. LP05-1]
MDNLGSRQQAAGSRQQAAGSRQQAAGSRQQAAGSRQGQRVWSVLFAIRSAAALYRLLDVLPVFAGDSRIERLFTLVPGSDFDVDALDVLARAEARVIGWEDAVRRPFDLILAASPKGGLDRLSGPLVLLPHGAGFNKSLPGEGSPGLPSGLDPAFLLRAGRALPTVHALAHPSQLDRLAAASAPAAARATVVGDPTLERMLQSAAHRDAYRTALGTGDRTLVVLASTWGPHSLLSRRPGLAAELAARLPMDGYQLALVVHPNEYSRLGAFDLRERLEPALAAGLVLARPFEEWAAVLVAADVVVCDHGSTGLYYAAAGTGPVLVACEGGGELIEGSPMAALLAAAPRLAGRESIDAALRGRRPPGIGAAARAAFAGQGRVLDLLRDGLYEQLGLEPVSRAPVTARALPVPSARPRRPAALAVRAEVADGEARVERLPVHTDLPVRFRCAEHGVAAEHQVRSADLLHRRAGCPPAGGPHRAAWTAAAWTAHVLEEYPGCRTAGVVLSPELCLVRVRGGDPLAVRVRAASEGGRVVRPDPVAVLCGVHAFLAGGRAPEELTGCRIGGRRYPVRLAGAGPEVAGREV